jgi:tRNA-2-methylthio-N6-dimethylallyladenosine synthase
LPELVAQLRAARAPVVAVGPNGEPSGPAVESACSPELPAGRPAGTNAFVPIIRGCNNRCAYCIVPSVRGPEISRPVDAVLGEVERAIAAGAVEITLLGQNVLAYGRDRDDGWHFARLLAAVHDVPGLVRLRFLTCHPRDVDDSLIQAMADLPRVCERIHLPLQAGNNELLAAMGRGYTVERYLDVLARLREGVPGLTVTTDLMVGFPGETEEQFEASLAVYAAARFDAAFTFAYSPRPGTRAATKEQFPRSVTQARLTRLIEQQNRITCEVHAAAAGSVAEVLVNGRDGKNPGQLTAHTRGHHAVVLPGGPELIGRTLTVRLTTAHLWGFHAEPTLNR